MMNPTAQLELLYRETFPQLVGYFRGKGAPPCDAEDLAQSAFARALRKPERLEDALSPRAFLFGIARHVWLDTVRRRRPCEEELSEGVAEVTEDPRLAEVRSAIAVLTLRLREPLLLKLQQGLSYAEIAEVLGIPVGTVRSRLHDAVRELRGVLNSDET